MKPSDSSIQPSRRSVLTGMFALSALALSSCAMGQSTPGSSAGAAGAKSANNVFGASTTAGLEVFTFAGGYGSEYPKKFVEIYNKTLPESKVELSSIQEIATQLQPRFVGANPPDVVNNAGSKALDVPTLISGKQLSSLKELLDAPSLDDPKKKISETLTAGVIESGSFDGDFMVLNYVNTVFGLWYDTALFAKNGWTLPKTWDEFIALGEKMKAQGIALFGYGGTNAISYVRNFVTALAVKQGGLDVIKNIDNLKPDAWRNENMRRALTAMAELQTKGLILKGSEGLQATEAQTAFVRNEVGFYPCGSWLENEMSNMTPAGVEITVSPAPLLDAKAAMDFSAIEVAPGEPYIIPAQAKNIAGGLEYLRSMLSKEGAKNFSELTNSPTVVQGALEGVKLTTGLASVDAAIAGASETNLRSYFNGWYPTIAKMYFLHLGNLLAGRGSVDALIDAVQKETDRVAADASIKKYTRP